VDFDIPASGYEKALQPKLEKNYCKILCSAFYVFVNGSFHTFIKYGDFGHNRLVAGLIIQTAVYLMYGV
jgi:hypothetical protein